MNQPTSVEVLDPIWIAVERVRQRLLRAINAIESAGIPNALTGDNAVAAWVGQVDPSAVRNTPDVTILIRRIDFAAASRAMISAGFVPGIRRGKDLFLDNPTANCGVQFFFANEPVVAGSVQLEPDIAELEPVGLFHVLSIRELARIKLATFRDRDRVNLRDMIDVGLIDQTWPARFPVELGARLQLLLDTPGG